MKQLNESEAAFVKGMIGGVLDYFSIYPTATTIFVVADERVYRIATSAAIFLPGEEKPQDFEITKCALYTMYKNIGQKIRSLEKIDDYIFRLSFESGHELMIDDTDAGARDDAIFIVEETGRVGIDLW